MTTSEPELYIDIYVDFRRDLIERLTSATQKSGRIPALAGMHCYRLDADLIDEVIATLHFVKDVVPDLMIELDATATFLSEHEGASQLSIINALIGRLKAATELL